eukprot:GEMP01013066.1.p1 GENE.GEMP01013066.1~~GEMP01013066.1.p1  ORF type:complete len:363 (+),score=121.08 GEMP01013066.1:30-1118(+)
MVKTSKSAVKKPAKAGKPAAPTRTITTTTTTTTVQQVATVVTLDGMKTQKMFRQQHGTDEKVDGLSVKRTQRTLTKKMTHVEKRRAGALCQGARPQDRTKTAGVRLKKKPLALKNRGSMSGTGAKKTRFLSLENKRGPGPMKAKAGRVKLAVQQAPKKNAAKKKGAAAAAGSRPSSMPPMKKKAPNSSQPKQPRVSSSAPAAVPRQPREPRQEPQQRQRLEQRAPPSPRSRRSESQETVRAPNDYHYAAKEEPRVAVKREVKREQRRSMMADDDCSDDGCIIVSGSSAAKREEGISYVKQEQHPARMAKEEPYGFVKEERRYVKEERSEITYTGVKKERNQFDRFEASGSVPSSQSSLIMLD